MPSLSALIASDFRSYRRPLLAQGFWATFNHRVFFWLYQIIPRPLNKIARLFHLLSIKLCEIVHGIYIGPNVEIGRALTIEHFGCIIIHSQVRIGDNVRLRQGVTIGNKSEALPDDVPTLGNGVDVGAGAKILGPVLIGDNSIVGANAVVVCDVPSGAMALGVPATIRYRNLH